MFCILFHSYESTDLITDNLDENDNYDDDMVLIFFEMLILLFIVIIIIMMYDSIADASYCHHIDHNVNSSSLSVSLTNVSVDNKCNLRST
jgi:hypothetical protein